MKNCAILFFLFLLFGCNNPKEKKSLILVKKEENTIIKKINKVVLRETFVDSTNIGIKGKYKIELNSYNSVDSTYVEIKFSEKQNNHWFQKQKITLPKDGIISCDSKTTIDFNNDKLNDFTFKSSIAARGANEIRTLLIFEKTNGKLKLITNSDNYPNLQYNEVLNCIDSWMVYGGTSTVFLKIDQDSLIEFAGVELYDNFREIYLVNEKGKHKTLKKEKIKDLEIYTRFKNFNPLIENETAN
ncbi:hypothetical protein SAMN05192550_0750 [Flavobacterium glycines]|uniref:Lipoprotein n=1 Tax=Flavobacterium glycines TaxID=551990 RepID=A0A1B9DTD2_9FLAO|nr:hypothetical protein [Flavobacterium glycines]OCB72941.1 hypothetical protein FBGL_04185 [Flavobacterium glycines]GEL10222.1 hypothetical protein FGL01_09610 [Flavobacterium glycines]SDI76371.1 hypothetical protein SAMN05192550_0750 [Flavobacterium glycines]